jgi:hypothetical protein
MPEDRNLQERCTSLAHQIFLAKGPHVM